MSLKLGIIGCGGIAGFHVRGYKLCEGVELTACADIRPERAQKFVSEHGFARAYDNATKMLDSEKLDLVSVCTPNYAHCEPTIAALKRNINVLCEKPIAMNAREALRMVQAARASKGLLTIGHNFRFLPFAQYLKRMLDAGELGHIYFGRSHALRRRGIPGWGEFHMKEKSGGGPLIDIGVHALDLILWLMGSPQPASVSGSVYTKFGNRDDFHAAWGEYRRKDYTVEDFACGLVKFHNGATLSLEASWAAHLPENETFPQLLLGDRGGAMVNMFGGTGPVLKIMMSRADALVDMEPHSFPQVDTHMEEIKYWVGCVRGENPVLVKPEESLNVQRIMDGVYKSSETGREVIVPGLPAEKADKKAKKPSKR